MNQRPLAPGLYSTVVDVELAEALALLERQGVEFEAEELAKLDREDAVSLLARHLHERLKEVLQVKPAKQLAIVQAVLHAIECAPLPDTGQTLRAIADEHGTSLGTPFPPRPLIPLPATDLLINARDEMTAQAAIASEIASADRIDLVMAFIHPAGVRLLKDQLQAHVDRARPAQGERALRVITSTYMAGSNPAGLRMLADLGANIRVSYDPRQVKLHAKAWLFHRDSGASTAYVGSSNLSRSALIDGCEWNVRLAALETPDVIKKFADSFAVLWKDPDFQPYDRARFKRAINQAKRKLRGDTDLGSDFAAFDIEPYPFQREILERLRAERELHGQRRNLVVAATGTGKTVIAAFDFQQLAEQLRAEGHAPTLLFVAHREELLRKARATYRAVLKNPNFGELLVGGEQPVEGQAVFASIQSLRTRVNLLRPKDFAVVVVDEFHHAEADSYKDLLKQIHPRFLLGLTATPERGDGTDILHWFDNRIAAEIRLWDALNRELLCPFHYYGVADNVDLSGLRWSRGGYELSELEGVYDGNDARVHLVLQAMRSYISDLGGMRGLGFCVSVKHADFMAARFNDAGIPAKAVSGKHKSHEYRQQAINELRQRKLRFLFAVDVFNEGIDIPEVDTLLFLRPTESAPLFLQQLGRGLRRSPGKTVTTVLDFIGNHHANFRFDRRFRALLSGHSSSVQDQIERDFPFLPPGCAIKLERQARERVLHNVKSALANQRSAAIEELRSQGRREPPALPDFLESVGWSREDLYRKPNAQWTWTSLRSDAGLCAADEHEDYPSLARAIGKLNHVEDATRLKAWRSWLSRSRPPTTSELSTPQRRLLVMLLALLWHRKLSRFSRLYDGLRALWTHEQLRRELVELVDLLLAERKHLDLPFRQRPDIPLRVHARYHPSEIIAACGLIEAGKFLNLQSGVRYVEADAVILNLVTINKDPTQYSLQTRYRDFALSPTQFHSESPNSYAPTTRAGKRFIEHRERDIEVLLFVRRNNKNDQGFTEPFVFLGPSELIRHEGSRPIAMTWRLEEAIPAWFYPETQLLSSS